MSYPEYRGADPKIASLDQLTKTVSKSYSSREGSLPANLQGIWSNKIQTPCNGDYHTDINVRMNYWPADLTNLAECYAPLTALIESLVKPGEITATEQYHASGWCVHPITNVWGFTSPGEHPGCGMHVGAGGWLCQHLWDHYTFTLAERIQAALDNLAMPQIAPDGRLMEWANVFPETEPAHRHVSHLYLLYPGTGLDVEKDTEMASAVKKKVWKVWENGHVRGLVARGGYVISMVWQNNKLQSAEVKSLFGGECIVKTSNPMHLENANAKNEKVIKTEGGYLLRFTATEGQTYILHPDN